MAYSNIDKPSKYFNTVAYAGAGGTQAVTGVGFKPDFVWIKNRSITADHQNYDIIRGTGTTAPLSVDSTDPQGFGVTVGSPSQYGYLSTFGSDGFTVVAGSVGGNFVNSSGNNFASWNWLASNTTTSNTSGSISSTISVNTTSGFSIVNWTGTGATGTVGHGLGVAPKMIIVKNKDQGTGGWNWATYHSSLGNTQDISLNRTDQATTNGFWNSTSPTSSVFSVSSNGVVNNNGNGIIAYCFAEIKGFSKISTYIGNGSANGTFVYTGFKPAFLVLKKSVASTNWQLFDNKRDPYNVMFKILCPNTTSAEATADPTVTNVDFLSNGFKLPTTWDGVNGSGTTYYYMAFAENPFVSSKGIPTTAR